MNILAIDTSSSYLSLALQLGDNAPQIFFEKVDNKQSENIIPQIKELLMKSGITVSELTHIAYNQGPGSFTGLRIGLCVALGIAYGIKALLIPIPAFAIYALQAYELIRRPPGQTQVLIGLDARLNQLYFAGVNAKTFEYFIQPQVINPNDITLIPELENMIVIGSGFKQYENLLPNEARTLLLKNLITPKYPDAAYLIRLAHLGKFAAVTTTNADLLYLRNKVALNLNEQAFANNKKSHDE
ncbi:MAG: tsaB [Burkholderiales bacterium]|jgi:tRNA threonylcarbamoyladenosine biosynthesis protein TsaB|nr:tsaB [Burkholderiales bacterium]